MAGTISPLTRRSLASREMANEPRTGLTSPSSPNSPMTIHSESRSRLIVPMLARRPKAIGRSKLGPAFFKSAGAKLAVM